MRPLEKIPTKSSLRLEKLKQEYLEQLLYSINSSTTIEDLQEVSFEVEDEKETKKIIDYIALMC